MQRQRTKCNAANHYQGTQTPICNGNHPCDKCIDIYLRAKLEAIACGIESPPLVNLLVKRMLEVLNKRQP